MPENVSMTEEQKQDAIDNLNSMLDSFVEKSPIMLTVEVPNREAADELLAWLYSKEKSPMKHAKLQSIYWDQELVTKREALAVRMIREGDQSVDVDVARDSIRNSILRLRNEVNCRIEHGAENGGHLDYVQGSLDAILKQEDADDRG